MGPSSRFLKIRKKRTHILKCVRSLYTSKRCLDHSITVHHQSLQGSFTIYNSYSTVYTLCGLQGSKHLLCYYNNSNTVQQIEDQGGRGGGKESFILRQFHVSWIGPQQGGEQLETIITARITYIARTWNGLKTHPWTFVLTEKNKYYLGYFFRQNITVSTCFHPQCSEYSSSRSVSF